MHLLIEIGALAAPYLLPAAVVNMDCNATTSLRGSFPSCSISVSNTCTTCAGCSCSCILQGAACMGVWKLLPVAHHLPKVSLLSGIFDWPHPFEVLQQVHRALGRAEW